MGLLQSSSAEPVEENHPSTSSVFNTSKVKWIRIQKLSAVGKHYSNYNSKQLKPDPVAKIRAECEDLVNPQSHDELETVMLYQGSENNSEYLHPEGNGLFSAISSAWATHGNVILSPDDLWMAIQLQFCRYMEANAEALRDTFVDHSGQILLTIDMTGCHTETSRYDWTLFMERTLKRIQDNVKNNVIDDFLPCFSTSTPLQTALKHLAVMDSMQRYFSYKYCTRCGIEQVGLTGTLKDWQLLRSKVNGLRKFHLAGKSGYFASLNGWIDDLLVILDQFVNTYQGNVNTRFWNKVMHEHVPRGSGGTKKLSGWLLTFLVSKYKQECKINEIPSTRFNVPVDVDDMGHEFKVRILGGFTGVICDNRTNTYQPQHSLTVVRVVEPASNSTKVDHNLPVRQF